MLRISHCLFWFLDWNRKISNLLAIGWKLHFWHMPYLNERFTWTTTIGTNGNPNSLQETGRIVWTNPFTRPNEFRSKKHARTHAYTQKTCETEGHVHSQPPKWHCFRITVHLDPFSLMFFPCFPLKTYENILWKPHFVEEFQRFHHPPRPRCDPLDQGVPWLPSPGPPPWCFLTKPGFRTGVFIYC